MKKAKGVLPRGTPRTVLVFSTYPISKPKHGGQLRSAALMNVYRRVFTKVVRCAIFYGPVYSRDEYTAQDIPSGKKVTNEIRSSPDLEPWILGASPITDPKIRARIVRMFLRHKPSAVIFEQPFLFRGITHVLEELGLNIPVIYSSHNVESEMMREVFQRSNSIARNEEFLRNLEETESQLARNAAGTIVVSHEDAVVFEAIGATRVLVQGNGIAPIPKPGIKRNRVARVKSDLAISSFALYVASSHRPNAESFFDVLGTRLGYLPQSSMIFFAGTVGRILSPLLARLDPIWQQLFWARAFNWEKVSPSTLAALIEQASCLLLPITTGGGSNLKTAEAIISGRPIVATSMAFRGFDEFRELPNIFICDTTKEFRSSVTGLLEQPFVVSDITNNQLRSKVLWSSTLNSLPGWLSDTLDR